jgi:hypothetical protein
MYIHTVRYELFSHTEESNLSFVAKQMKLEGIILSELSQTRKNYILYFPFWKKGFKS